eukprot:748226-Hanusia_phi.AAC.4
MAQRHVGPEERPRETSILLPVLISPRVAVPVRYDALLLRDVEQLGVPRVQLCRSRAVLMQRAHVEDVVVMKVVGRHAPDEQSFEASLLDGIQVSKEDPAHYLLPLSRAPLGVGARAAAADLLSSQAAGILVVELDRVDVGDVGFVLVRLGGAEEGNVGLVLAFDKAHDVLEEVGKVLLAEASSECRSTLLQPPDVADSPDDDRAAILRALEHLPNHIALHVLRQRALLDVSRSQAQVEAVDLGLCERIPLVLTVPVNTSRWDVSIHLPVVPHTAVVVLPAAEGTFAHALHVLLHHFGRKFRGMDDLGVRLLRGMDQLRSLGLFLGRSVQPIALNDLQAQDIRMRAAAHERLAWKQ